MFCVLAMSLFSKSPKDPPPSPKPEAQPNKPPSAGRPAAPRTGPLGQPPPPEQALANPAPPARPAPHGPAPGPAAREGGPIPQRNLTSAGDAAATRARPAMPAIAIGPPAVPVPPAVPPPPAVVSPPVLVPHAVATSPAAASAFGPPPATPAVATRPDNAESSLPHASPAAPPAAAAARGAIPVGSVRPTAPNLPDSTTDKAGAQPSIAGTFERLLSLEDLDEGFASMQRSGEQRSSHSAGLTDLAEVRSLFAQLAVNHVRQVRDFMIDLRWRDATVEWIGICEPALRSLRRAADKLELGPLCSALDRFSEALAFALSGQPGASTIDGERRDRLLLRYDELCALMPQAFVLDVDRSQREGVILQSLLLQVPDVKKVTLDRLYAAGLTTLEAMSLATPGDVAATTGIPLALATCIIARFREYRDTVKSGAPDATRARERERLAVLTAKLRREHDDYERTNESWTGDAPEKKKALRKARAQTLLDVQVLLARLGEVDRLREIERQPFERKVTHLEAFLAEAHEKYTAQP
jgi:hypothetical protein